jgi:hypothetical protein
VVVAWVWNAWVSVSELLSPRLDPRRVHRPLHAGDLDLDLPHVRGRLLPLVAPERGGVPATPCVGVPGEEGLAGGRRE